MQFAQVRFLSCHGGYFYCTSSMTALTAFLASPQHGGSALSRLYFHGSTEKASISKDSRKTMLVFSCNKQEMIERFSTTARKMKHGGGGGRRKHSQVTRASVLCNKLSFAQAQTAEMHSFARDHDVETLIEGQYVLRCLSRFCAETRADQDSLDSLYSSHNTITKYGLACNSLGICSVVFVCLVKTCYIPSSFWWYLSFHDENESHLPAD